MRRTESISRWVARGRETGQLAFRASGLPRYVGETVGSPSESLEDGIGDSRSAVIRRGVHYLADSVRRARVGASIAKSYRERPQTPEDDELAMASATAMTEAEPW